MDNGAMNTLTDSFDFGFSEFGKRSFDDLMDGNYYPTLDLMGNGDRVINFAHFDEMTVHCMDCLIRGLIPDFHFNFANGNEQMNIFYILRNEWRWKIQSDNGANRTWHFIIVLASDLSAVEPNESGIAILG